MKLDPDCIRDILFYVEDKCSFRIPVDFYPYDHHDKIENIFETYDENTLFYHVTQCINFGFIEKGRGSNISIRINDLTPQGHLFLADIREDNNWNKTKEIASKVGSFSITTLKDIAVGIITESINNYLK